MIKEGLYNYALKAFIFVAVLTALFLIFTTKTFSHPGRTAADGCHYCRTNCSNWGVSHNSRHCHQNKGIKQPYEPIRSHRDGTTEIWEPYKTPIPRKTKNNFRLFNKNKKCQFTWINNLSRGSVGNDVLKLQKFLNLNKDTQVSVIGFGSPGNETSYYGPATARAIKKFQEKHRDVILKPLGLTNGTSLFYDLTRKHANNLCK